MRVLVTGSRDWTNEDAVRYALYEHTEVVKWGATIVHGDCPTGADAHAERWVQHNVKPFGARAERHPAKWQEHGRAAGPKRNAEMVARGADLCLAFIGPCTSPRCRVPGEHDSHGATGCADLAEAAGIPTIRERQP